VKEGALVVGEAEPRYREVPFPAARHLVIDSGRMGVRRHLSHGLLEVDVTRPRQSMLEHKARTGESLSFTAFVVACLAQAIARSLRSGLPELAWPAQIFSGVDVVTDQTGGVVALPHIISANQAPPDPRSRVLG
jgi:hypothetical protein